MATTFNAQQKGQLAAHGVTAAQCDQLAAAGVDPAKFVAAVPQLKAQVEAAGLDWNRWFQLLMQLAPIILSFLNQPAPGPVVPAVQT
jgi:hypothetical protein